MKIWKISLIVIIFLLILILLGIIFIIFVKRDKLYTGWVGYRLGDMVKGKVFRKKFDGRFLHYLLYPHSIASQYMKQTDKENDYDILLKIIQKKRNQTPSDAAIIHLRVGDVFENGYCWKVKPKVEDFLRKNMVDNLGRNYIKPIQYYKDYVPLLKKHNISKIILVAGSHQLSLNYKKSYKYINAIKKFFEKNGFKVTLRLGKNPDEDLIFMSNAKYFIPSGGGYSDLIAKLQKKSYSI